MAIRSDPHPIRDFFIGDLIDYAPKDSAEMMERPFFSLAKKKRNKPIEYASPDGKLWIKVNANPNNGMATIWDADILIWCISRIMAQRDRGVNDIRPIVHTTPYELLKGIARGTAGQDYVELMNAIRRLRTTEVETNIRSGRRRYTAFHYLGDIDGEGEGPEDPTQLKSLSLRIPDWLLDGIMNGDVLTLDREYFLLKGGLERAIYRIARKHVGNQVKGWTVKIETLRLKTGSEGAAKKFAFRVREMCKNEGDPEKQLPRYRMVLTTTQDGAPAIHFADRELANHLDDQEKAAQARRRRERLAIEDARTAAIDAGKKPPPSLD